VSSIGARLVHKINSSFTDVQFQLVYTAGAQQALDNSPDRWTATQQLLGLVAQCAGEAKDLHPDEVEFRENGPGKFASIRLLNVPGSGSAGQTLRRLVATRVLHGDLPHFNVNHLTSSSERDAILRFITEQNVDPDVYALAKSLCEGSWPTVLLLRGLLGFGILGITVLSTQALLSLTTAFQSTS
jgi:hypothetical protein